MEIIVSIKLLLLWSKFVDHAFSS